MVAMRKQRTAKSEKIVMIDIVNKNKLELRNNKISSTKDNIL
jgi:hypothetical protein